MEMQGAGMEVYYQKRPHWWDSHQRPGGIALELWKL